MRKYFGIIGSLGLLAALGLYLYFTQGSKPDSEQTGDPFPRVEGALDAGAARPIRVAGQEPPPQSPPSPAQTPPFLLERATPAAGAPAPRPIAQLAPEAAPSGPVDKRENPGPNAKRQMEILRYGFETLDEDISECLAQWNSVEPGQATEVMIAFEIDADGLQRSWLEHDGGIPFGPRTCLANAVYGIDWSHIVDQPAKLTNRFYLDRDAGP